MSIPHTWRRAVTRLRPTAGSTDAYGDTVPGPPTTEQLPDALFNPGLTTQPLDAGAAPIVQAPTVYWAGQWPDVTPGDTLVIGGIQYRVEGRPAQWPLGLSVTLTGPLTDTEEPAPWRA